MKIILLVITILATLPTLADERPLCRMHLNNESFELCAKEKFFTEHTETYYGATLYVSDRNEKILGHTLVALATMTGQEKNLLAKHNQELLKAKKVALVIEEQDMPFVAIYILIDGDVKTLLKTTAIDWFGGLGSEDFDMSNPETMFGFSKDDIIESFSI